MSDSDSKAEESKYDENPLSPPDEDSDDSGDGSTEDFPNKGDDESAQIPEVNMLWLSPPSFNLSPQGGSSGGEDNSVDAKAPYTERPISVDTESIRSGEETMLQSTKDAVSSYKKLQSSVAEATDISADDEGDNTFGVGLETGSQPGSKFAGGTPQPDVEMVSSQFDGKEFADVINPLQQQVLAGVGSLLETTGEFIAMINQAGQAMAQADRDSEFPEPPPRA
ncbi:hypothetical protein [Streptomyces sp. ODS28]|uniref:hypothetical protein n=1 Tax=Streptomyces sp. ODS28 TaxID=3136688 RepID=UPI0031EA8B32